MTSYSDDAFTVNGEVDPAKIPAFLPRKQAATGRPKPVNVAYIRTDDHADMIERSGRINRRPSMRCSLFG